MKQYKASIYEFEDSWKNKLSVEERIARSEIIRQYLSGEALAYEDPKLGVLYIRYYSIHQDLILGILEDIKKRMPEKLPRKFIDPQHEILVRYLSGSVVMLTPRSRRSHSKSKFKSDYMVNAWV